MVYVDNEHVAVAHSQLILESNDNAAMVHADITKAGLVLGDPTTRRLLDFDQPVGLLAITIGHYILDDALAVFDAYRDALVPGSYLAHHAPHRRLRRDRRRGTRQVHEEVAEQHHAAARRTR